jgi:hypothetical protein
VIVVVAESSHNSREARDTDTARDRASKVSAVREVKKMTPRVLLHVSELEITKSWKCEDVRMLTVAQFCENMENFNARSFSTEAIVESINDDRDIDRSLSSRIISSEIFEWNQ